MKQFWAKVRFKDEDEEQAAKLVRAFFLDFNPESSIVIRDKEARLEIFFDRPPSEIIGAMKDCEILEMFCGKDLKEYEGSKKKEAEPKNSEKTKGRKERPAKKDKPEPEPIDIPELEEMAKKAESFEHFAKLVAEWLEMDKRQGFFENLVIATAEVDKVSWKSLEAALKNKGVSYTEWDRLWSANQVSAKMENYSVTIMQLLKILEKYKDYPFNADIPKKRVKMKCMPEIKAFEETLGSIDQTQPIEERVYYVLSAMGLSKLPDEQKEWILKIANTAVKTERLDLDNTLIEANIPDGDVVTARMTFSQFINDFAKQYDSEKNVKLFAFLEQLQRVIITESDYSKLFLNADS